MALWTSSDVSVRCDIASRAEAGGASGWLHGDTFGLLIPRMHSGLHARETANRVLVAFAPLRASIGIAVYPGDGRDARGMIGCAAAALARARCEKRPTYCFYLSGPARPLAMVRADPA